MTPVDVLILGILLAVAMAFVGYFTRRSRNFRSGRNKKARKKFKSAIERASASER